MKTQKTTVEIVEEAFAKLGCKRIPAGYTPPKSRGAKAKARPAKPSGNGSKK